jgi:hypothetical protein
VDHLQNHCPYTRREPTKAQIAHLEAIVKRATKRTEYKVVSPSKADKDGDGLPLGYGDGPPNKT